MSGRLNRQDKEHLDELKEMVNERKKGESAEEILTFFCHRHGIDMAQCRKYYDQLVANGEIKGK